MAKIKNLVRKRRCADAATKQDLQETESRIMSAIQNGEVKGSVVKELNALKKEMQEFDDTIPDDC